MATGKRYYWIKLKDSFMTSDSVDYVMSQPNGSEYVVIYQMLCLKTINTNGRLARKIGDVVIPYDARKLSRDLKFFKAETIQKAIDIFRSLGLIYDDNGILAMTDHENLVGCETDWSGQKRRQRDTPDGQTGGQAEDTSVDNARTDRGQSCGQNSENVHTDIRDKEKDIDIRDKEIIKRESVTRARARERDKQKESVKEFVPPTLEEITAYCEERHSPVNPRAFFDYYSASKWIDSRGSPVTNWKQRVIAWESDEEKKDWKPKKKKPAGSKPHEFTPTQFD